MNEDSKQLLIGFYLKFCQDRKAQYRRYWTKDVLKRIFNRDKATVRTLSAEISFFPSKVNDFDRFVKGNFAAGRGLESKLE